LIYSADFSGPRFLISSSKFYRLSCTRGFDLSIARD